MSLSRDLTLENLDLSYRTSIAYQYGRYAMSLNYDMFPEEVLHAAKRSLLDTIGCAIGAYEAEGFPIVQKLAKDLGGNEEATVFGTGLRTTATNVTLANVFLVHYLGYNDLGGGGHNSDTIPAILAVAEREKANGRDFLTSMIMSYELGARFSESPGGFECYEALGFPFDIRGGVTLPPCIGKLMGLNEMQIANAIGICASHSLPLGVLDTNHEEHFHAKNLRMGFVARDAIESCILAKHGFTGPIRVIEGDHGFREVVMKGQMYLDKAVDWSGWRILNVKFKNLCLNSTTMGQVQATLKIVIDNNLYPEDIASVKIGTGYRDYMHTASLPKKFPRNAETVDHGAFYANAVAIRDHRYTTNAMNPNNYDDPVILDLIDKISIKPHPDLGEWSSGGITEITTKDGRTFVEKVAHPYGLGAEDLSDAELEKKFYDMASKYFSDNDIQHMFDIIWNVEKLSDISTLAKMTILPQK
ncbi:MAG: MmgE/PrpD family protein [Syntrophomonas sp.]